MSFKDLSATKAGQATAVPGSKAKPTPAAGTKPSAAPVKKA